jgi:hypothetical protein
MTGEVVWKRRALLSSRTGSCIASRMSFRVGNHKLYMLLATKCFIDGHK